MIAAYMLSCPERAAAREVSLESFARTDWGAPMKLYVHEARSARKEERIAEGMLTLLRRALDEAGDYLLICEDDVLFVPRLRERVERWAPLRVGAVGMASLYNSGATGRNWRGRDCPDPEAIIVDPEEAIGSQARLFSRACAEHVVREFRPSPWIQDVAVARLAAQSGPLLCHVPSLVQHTGRVSTWGGPFHEAPDFRVAA